MGADSYTPITTKNRLSLPLNGIIYTTTRAVASEKPLPVLGDTMTAELGPAFAASRIVAVGDGPDKSKGVLSITHATIPSEAEQLASNWEHTTCDIGGIKFDSVSRTVILLASAYSETAPATGTVMPTGTPFTAANYILENRQTVNSGTQLEPVFRVERRNYVKRTTISEVEITSPFRVGLTKTTTLYYRGETIEGTPIESLISNPDASYWKIQGDGAQRQGQQLSEDWFSVVELAIGGGDSVATQESYNFEWHDADIGGHKFSGCTRTYIIPRSSFSTASPAMGSAIPATGTLFTGYILSEREQARSGDAALDGLFVVEKRSYVKRATISDINTDPTLGVGVQKLTTLYYRGEDGIEGKFADPTNAYWGIQASGINRQGEQLTDNWFAVIETSSREAALLAYKQAFPTTVNLPRLPDILDGIDVIWNKAESTGFYNSDWAGESASMPATRTHLSLSGSESAQAEASASLQAELSINIRSPDGYGLPATAVMFYMKLTGGVLSESEFLSRVGAIVGGSVSRWPLFAPVAHSITTKGMKVAVSAKASASAASGGTGDSTTGEGYAAHEKNEGSGNGFDVSTINGVTRIPPTIHGDITISDPTESATATATCDVGWTGGGDGTIIAGINLDFPSTTASASATMDALGEVSPTFLPATVPPAIPNTGLYLNEPRIQPFEPGWVQCYAEVFNAANLPLT